MKTVRIPSARCLLSLALALILLTLLCACGEQTPPSTPPDTTNAPDTTDAAPDRVIIGGDAVYQLIRPERGTDAEIENALNLKTGIQAKAGIDLIITDDWFRNEEDLPAYEILVGEVNRAETRAALADLNYHDFTVRLSGDKLVVLGATLDGTARAVNYLLENLLTETGLSLPADFCYTYRGPYSAEGISIGGVPIGEFRIVYDKKDNLENAELLRRVLGEHLGVSLPVEQIGKTDAGESLFVVGSTPIKTMEPADFYAYHVPVEGGNVFFNGYDRYAYGNAFLAVTEILEKNGG